MSFTLNQTITDPQSCYKVFTSDIAKKLHLKENGFSFCNELIFNIHKMGIKKVYTPKDFDLNKIIMDISGIVKEANT